MSLESLYVVRAVVRLVGHLMLILVRYEKGGTDRYTLPRNHLL